MRIDLPKYFTKDQVKITGIYFLIYKRKVVYIGQSKNIISRINSHTFKFDHVRIMQCQKKHLCYFEKKWIEKFKPKHNVMHLYDRVTSYKDKKQTTFYARFKGIKSTIHGSQLERFLKRTA